MLLRMIAVPFFIVKHILKFLLSIAGVCLYFCAGFIRFFTGRIAGTVLGGLLGGLLGSGNIKIKTPWKR